MLSACPTHQADKHQSTQHISKSLRRGDEQGHHRDTCYEEQETSRSAIYQQRADVRGTQQDEEERDRAEHARDDH